MNTSKLLDCIEVETSTNIDSAVIWLHGLGASGHDFEPIVPILNLPRDAGVRFIFPHAPAIPVTINGGMVMPAWYDILEMSIERKVDVAQIEASAAAIAALVEREISRGVDSKRIVIAGFSQGGAVAYEYALSAAVPLAGLMTMSSYFATATSIRRHEANAALPIQIYHGTHDPMVPEELGRRAVQQCQAFGYAPNYTTYAMAHEVCPEQIKDIGERLSDWLALE